MFLTFETSHLLTSLLNSRAVWNTEVHNCQHKVTALEILTMWLTILHVCDFGHIPFAHIAVECMCPNKCGIHCIHVCYIPFAHITVEFVRFEEGCDNESQYMAQNYMPQFLVADLHECRVVTLDTSHLLTSLLNLWAMQKARKMVLMFLRLEDHFIFQRQ